MKVLTRAEKTANKVLSDPMIGLVNPNRIATLRAALKKGSRDQIVQATNMIKTALWLLREV